MIMTDSPFESIKSCMAFHARDWSKDRRDAWMYGVVCGWDDAAMSEVAEAHGWGPGQVARLRVLRERFVAVQEAHR